MSKKPFSGRSKEGKLRCPVCHEFMADIAEGGAFGQKSEFALSQPGDLTECEHCRTMLEFSGDDPASLVVRRASPERVRWFNRLAQEDKEPSIPELIEYVRKYRLMPPGPATGYRFRNAHSHSIRSSHKHGIVAKPSAPLSPNR
jgi:hypothetical protein